MAMADCSEAVALNGDKLAAGRLLSKAPEVEYLPWNNSLGEDFPAGDDRARQEYLAKLEPHSISRTSNVLASLSVS